ncbi:MAG: T9SS type A sorting domain-containing protein [Reichenbachiella sp.]
MKKSILTLVIYLITFHLVTAQCDFCDHILEPFEDTGHATGIRFNALEENVRPGDTICMKAGTYYNWHTFNDLAGEKDNPIVIINCGGLVTIEASTNGLQTRNSHDFVISGAGDPDTEYGILVKGGENGIILNTFSINYQVDHVIVDGAKFHGLDLKNDPYCDDPRVWRYSDTAQPNESIKVFHTKIINTGLEGMYLGGSHYQKAVNCLWAGADYETVEIWESSIIDVDIHDNIVDWTGNDGIQIGSAIGEVRIYDNKLYRFGQTDQTGQHRSGFQINPGTKAILYNNTIIQGEGSAFFISGDGVEIYNNIVDSVKTAVESYNNLTSPESKYLIYNNTFLNLRESGYAIITADHCLPNNYSKNNIFHSWVLDDFWRYQQGEFLTVENMPSDNNIITDDLTELGLDDQYRPIENSILVGKGECEVAESVNSDEIVETDHSGLALSLEGKCDIGALKYHENLTLESKEVLISNIALYPNPIEAGKFLNIELDALTLSSTIISIFDLGGNEIFKTSKNRGEVLRVQIPTNVKSGVYLVQTISPESSVKMKRLFIRN